MKLRPVGDMVLIRLDKAVDKTESGILLPGDPDGGKGVHSGTVEATGKGAWRTRKGRAWLEPVPVVVGDRVVFRGFLQYVLPADKYSCFVHMDDLLMVVDHDAVIGNGMVVNDRDTAEATS